MLIQDRINNIKNLEKLLKISREIIDLDGLENRDYPVRLQKEFIELFSLIQFDESYVFSYRDIIISRLQNCCKYVKTVCGINEIINHIGQEERSCQLYNDSLFEGQKLC